MKQKLDRSTNKRQTNKQKQKTKTKNKKTEWKNKAKVRDRPFNLKGGYGFLFRSDFFFSDNRELEYFFFLSR